MTTVAANIAKPLGRFPLTDPPESEPDDTISAEHRGETGLHHHLMQFMPIPRPPSGSEAV